MDPLIFILDLDGTIIGNIMPQLYFHELKQDHIPISYNIKNLHDRFESGLIRPYFESFIKKMKHAEFFIYTASEDKWANYIIGQIEKHLRIKFNRPIFSRKHCIISENKIQKSLNIIMPSIKRCMQKKYGKQINYQNKILIIDNNHVYDDPKQLLVCPSYNHMIAENIPAFINEHLFIRYKPIILEKLSKYFPHFSGVQTYKEFQQLFYKYYLEYLNLSDPKDTFWFLLYKLIEMKNIHTFSPRAIEYMNKKLSRS